MANGKAPKSATHAGLLRRRSGHDHNLDDDLHVVLVVLDAKMVILDGIGLAGGPEDDALHLGRPAVRRLRQRSRHAVPAASLVLLVAGTLLVRGAPADYRRAWWNLLVWAGVALAISLPPRVELFGRALTTPMGWLASSGVPIVTVRDTRRLGIRMLLAASLATGLALDRILALAAGRLRRRWMWGARAAAAAVVCGASHDS